MLPPRARLISSLLGPALLTAALLAPLGGCTPTPRGDGETPEPRRERPRPESPSPDGTRSPLDASDRGFQSRSPEPAQPPARSAPRQEPSGEGGSQTDRQATGASPQPGLPVAGMIGQVNGRPLYADRVLNPISGQLEALGRNSEVNDATYKARAQELIASRLRQIVADELMLGEAQRDLNQRERQGLAARMAERREELLRYHGGGSVAAADARLRRETGKGLEATLREEREALIVQRYLSKKIRPKISVSRRDIARYYHDYRDRYAGHTTRTIRMIRTDDPEAAETIDRRLADGESFTALARSELNQYRPEKAGRFAKAIRGEEIFGHEAMNAAVLELETGEHSQRLELGSGFVWLFLENLEGGQARTLKEVQLEIENRLRRQRMRRLTREYRETLFREGVYHPIDQMADVLLDIAIARYRAETANATG